MLLLLLSHCTPLQVVYPDKVPAIMQSPHPAVLSDGSMVNFSRVFPFGGTHLFKQDRVTLKRQEVGTRSVDAHGSGSPANIHPH